MKLIDADAIIAALEAFSDRAHGNQHYLNGIETTKELIAEADETVVRCEDCKYCIFQPGTMYFEEMFQYYCTKFKPFKRRADDFCSRGERGTNEAD